MPPILGCIADDFTGATDLASMLVRGGLRTVQVLDVSGPEIAALDVDAVVVALKSRSVPPGQAVRVSLEALSALERAGVERFFFKYCSTFDSTPKGNIGPVAEALMSALNLGQIVFCPAFPENGRTVYQGYLFVHDELLSESGMRRHPVNPMTDANLVRVLERQSSRPVGLLPYSIVDRGAEAISEERVRLRGRGQELIIADAVNDSHLESLANELCDMRLVTGGSAIALHLARAYRDRGLISRRSDSPRPPDVPGAAVVIAGSCSEATRRQVAFFESRRPVYRIDPLRVAAGEPVVDEVLEWAATRLASGPVLICSTASPQELDDVHRRLGRDVAASLVERTLSEIARELHRRDVRRFVVAGGETSGAVLEELGVKQLRIGPHIAPGVPWTESAGPRSLALALKSGNFGGDDFFLKALEMLS